jgi:hypothetical protein
MRGPHAEQRVRADVGLLDHRATGRKAAETRHC